VAVSVKGGGLVSVGLAEAIRALRTELSEAIQAGEDEQLRFVLGVVELDLEFVVEQTKGVDGGIRFWVVSVGGKAEHRSTATQRVRLSLTPRSGGGEVLVDDRDVGNSGELPE
jgi:hypothetical protein